MAVEAMACPKGRAPASWFTIAMQAEGAAKKNPAYTIPEFANGKGQSEQ
jgi:hypothetical protein